VSCSGSSCEDCVGDKSEIIVDSETFNTSQAHANGFVSVTIEGDCLTMVVSGSGCDGLNWMGTLVDSGAVAESLPPQRTLKFVLDNPEACLAIVQREFKFDICDLKVDGEVSVLLNIDNHSEAILYEF